MRVVGYFDITEVSRLGIEGSRKFGLAMLDMDVLQRPFFICFLVPMCSPPSSDTKTPFKIHKNFRTSVLQKGEIKMSASITLTPQTR